MITLEDYFGRVSHVDKPSDEVKENALELLTRVNLLLGKIAIPEAQEPKINSGWRPAAYNANVPGAAPNSKHITGQAIDISDPEGALDDLLADSNSLLVDHGLWLEHPSATKGWAHLQCVPPRSNRRVFYP